MRRLLLLSVACFGFAVGAALAAPNRPLHEPAFPPKVPPRVVLVNLSGTVWQGKYNAANRIYVFEADGTVSYKSSPLTKTAIKNRGTWKLEGDTFYFEHHIGNKANLLEFRGRVQSPDTIVGEQTMVRTGVKSAVTMTRTAP